MAGGNLKTDLFISLGNNGIIQACDQDIVVKEKTDQIGCFFRVTDHQRHNGMFTGNNLVAQFFQAVLKFLCLLPYGIQQAEPLGTVNDFQGLGGRCRLRGRDGI